MPTPTNSAWLEYIRTFWPIITVLTPIIVIGFILWLKTQFPLKSDLDVERQRIDGHGQRISTIEGRIVGVEKECGQAPTRQALQGELSNLGQRMRGVEVQTEAVGRQLATANDYLHTLIQKGIDK